MRRRLGCLTKRVDPAGWPAGTTCEGIGRRRALLDQLHDDRRRDTLRIDRVGVAGDLPLQPPVLPLVMPAVPRDLASMRRIVLAIDSGSPESAYRLGVRAAAYDCRPRLAPQRRLRAAQRPGPGIGHRAPDRHRRTAARAGRARSRRSTADVRVPGHQRAKHRTRERAAERAHQHQRIAVQRQPEIQPRAVIEQRQHGQRRARPTRIAGAAATVVAAPATRPAATGAPRAPASAPRTGSGRTPPAPRRPASGRSRLRRETGSRGCASPANRRRTVTQASASNRASATSGGAASPNDGAVAGATASSIDPGSQSTSSNATAATATIPNAVAAPSAQRDPVARPARCRRRARATASTAATSAGSVSAAASSASDHDGSTLRPMTRSRFGSAGRIARGVEREHAANAGPPEAREAVRRDPGRACRRPAPRGSSPRAVSVTASMPARTSGPCSRSVSGHARRIH